MKIQESLEEFRYDVLSATEKQRIEVHLLGCAECKIAFERIRTIEQSLLSLAGGERVPKAKIRVGVERILARGTKSNRLKEVVPMVAATILFGIVVSWLIGPVPPPPVSGRQDTKGIFEEKKLLEIDSQKPEGVVFSPDGKTWAYPTRVGETGMAIVVGAERGDVYANVGKPYFSPDGKKVAYVALDQKSRKMFVVVGKTRGEEFLSIKAPQIVSREGGKLGVIFHEWVDGALDWAPDGSAVTYIGKSEQGVHVVVGNKKSEPFIYVGELAWSPDGHTLAYSAIAGKDALVVVGDRKGEIFDSVRHLTWSPDGTILAYSAQEGNRFQIVRGGTKEPAFQGVGRPVFSPDGKALAHVALVQGSTELITINGVTEHRYGAVVGVRMGDPVFSPDGKHLAYKAIGTDTQWVVVDGKKEKAGEFDQVGNPVFGPEGTIVAYVAMKGQKQLVVMGDQVGEKFTQVSHLIVSPDGRSVAYRAERFGKQVVVAGGAISDEFEDVTWGPFFSSDSKSVAFVVRQGSEFWSKVLKVP
jgi:Tol biopolymer transport system component